MMVQNTHLPQSDDSRGYPEDCLPVWQGVSSLKEHFLDDIPVQGGESSTTDPLLQKNPTQ